MGVPVSDTLHRIGVTSCYLALLRRGGSPPSRESRPLLGCGIFLHRLFHLVSPRISINEPAAAALSKADAPGFKRITLQKPPRLPCRSRAMRCFTTPPPRSASSDLFKYLQQGSVTYTELSRVPREPLRLEYAHTASRTLRGTIPLSFIVVETSIRARRLYKDCVTSGWHTPKCRATSVSRRQLYLRREHQQHAKPGSGGSQRRLRLQRCDGCAAAALQGPGGEIRGVRGR